MPAALLNESTKGS